jgi:hypothetical protein
MIAKLARQERCVHRAEKEGKCLKEREQAEII